MKHEGQGVGALKRGIRIGHKDEYRKSIVSASMGYEKETSLNSHRGMQE